MNVSMSLLGKYGRFGNQLFQYAALRIYARRYGLQLQTAPWIGEDLFGIKPSPVTTVLPPYEEGCGTPEKPCVDPPVGLALQDRDFRGYAQYHTSYFAPHRKWLRELYRPGAAMQERLEAPLQLLRQRGKTIVGLQLRRDDYGRLAFYITPVSWYLEWLRKNWDTLDNPVLFIATESPQLVEKFARYNPLTPPDLGVDLATEPLPTYHYLGHDMEKRDPWQMDFFPDWYFLTQSDIMLIPNSTFSFTAAMFSDTVQHTFRSDLPTQEFVEIDPWNVAPLTYDQAEDWNHIPGVCLNETPYWKRLADGRFEG